jgi:hypothetical protein
VRDYDDLHRICRARVEKLDVSRLTVDDAAGFTSGHAAKILAEKPARRLGPVTMGLMLRALGIKLVAVEDAEALARIKPKLTKRAWVPPPDVMHWRQQKREAAAAMLPKEAPKIPAQVERGTEWAQAMNARRAAQTSKAERRKIARVASRERWKRSA